MTWSVDPSTPAVAIYREMLVNYNEPFILALGEALDRYCAWYVGMRRVDGLDTLPDRTIVLNSGTRPSAAAESIFKLLGLAPASFMRALRRVRPTILHAFTGVSGAQALPLARRLLLPLFVGTTGLLAREGDEEGLAASIVQLLTDRPLWTSMSRAAAIHARERFDLRRQTRALESMYDEARGLSH